MQYETRTGRRAATPLLTPEKICNDFPPAPRWLGDVELALAPAAFVRRKEPEEESWS